MLTMLLTRPGAAWLMLYCSASRTRSLLRYGEPGGYSVNTTPPGRIDVGAYGASVAAPGFGTARGAGSGARAFCARATVAVIVEMSSTVKVSFMTYRSLNHTSTH